MGKFLICDVDNSLAAIGGDPGAEKLSGLPPLPITGGVLQISNLLQRTLFVKKEVMRPHPLFPSGVKDVQWELSTQGKELGIEGLVIDTISHCFRQDMRLREALNKSGAMEMQDWGFLERTYAGFVELLKRLPVWVVLNSHISYEKDGNTGTFYFAPGLKGQSRDFLTEYFDCVFYTKTNKDKKLYTWQTYADAARWAKDRLGLFDPFIKQDFSVVLKAYRDNGFPHPKICVIGESGTGKTKAIATLSTPTIQP